MIWCDILSSVSQLVLAIVGMFSTPIIAFYTYETHKLRKLSEIKEKNTEKRHIELIRPSLSIHLDDTKKITISNKNNFTAKDIFIFILKQNCEVCRSSDTIDSLCNEKAKINIYTSCNKEEMINFIAKININFANFINEITPLDNYDYNCEYLLVIFKDIRGINYIIQKDILIDNNKQIYRLGNEKTISDIDFILH